MRCRTCSGLLETAGGQSFCPRCSIEGALSISNQSSKADGPIDGYELLEPIGQGAMGVVWRALDRKLDRLVAVKVIAAGGVPNLAQRLIREGQAAARLRHPNIVTIHAMGGSGDAAFLVMDLHERGNLDVFLGGKPMAPRLAAELLSKLAGALGYAHAEGLLHRDLKPSNILMDEEGEPRIADFGLAAPTEGAGDLTLTGQIAGTPSYMAPEIVNGVEHASCLSDIYGLGAVLYTCITGRPPFLGSTNLVLKQLNSDDPVAPRLLQPELPRDLETICLKAIEKNPHQRYPSAEAFRDDLQRFLRGEPISARPIGKIESGTRWCRRNPSGATAIGMAAVILLMFAVGGPLVALRLNRARQAAEAASASAVTEMAKSKAISDFLQNDLLAQAAPDNQPDRELKLRTVLDAAAKKLDRRFTDEPLVGASIRVTLGETYTSLGEFFEAEKQFERAVATFREQLGAEDPTTLKATAKLAACYLNQQKLKEAEALETKTLAAEERVFGAENVETVKSMGNMAAIFFKQGKLPQAVDLFQRALEIQRRVAPEDVEAGNLMASLAMIYWAQGKIPDASQLMSRAVDAKTRTFGAENPATLKAMENLAIIYTSQGKLSHAETLLQTVLRAENQVLGPEHPETVRAMNSMAIVYYLEDRLEEAGALWTKVVDFEKRTVGSEHPDTLRLTTNLAMVWMREGRLDEAESLQSEAISTAKRVLGPEHPDVLSWIHNLGIVHWYQSKLSQAETEERLALDAEKRLLGSAHTETIKAANALCIAAVAAAGFAPAGCFAVPVTEAAPPASDSSLGLTA